MDEKPHSMRRLSGQRRAGAKNRPIGAQAAFFSQGDPADASSICKRAGQRSRWFRQSARKPPSRCSPQAILWEKSRWRRWLGCVWPRPPPHRLHRAQDRREEMIRVMHEEHDFSDLFLKFLLARSMRIQADLVDQLFNSSEKRLARILLLMAEFGQAGRTGTADSQDLAGDAGGDDRHHAVPRQLLHEPLSQARLYRIQRPHPRPQVAAQCDSARRSPQARSPTRLGSYINWPTAPMGSAFFCVGNWMKR
jgi:hypothetical protein